MMYEYYILLFLSLVFGVWLNIKKKKINIRKLLITNGLLLLIAMLQLKVGEDIGLAGYHDLIFFILFQCSGILIFFMAIQINNQALLKIYGSLLMILIIPTSFLILLDERPDRTKVANGIEIRRTHGKILTCGHLYAVAVNEYFIFEKNITIPINSGCQFEKSKKIELRTNQITLTVNTIDGEVLQRSVVIPNP